MKVKAMIPSFIAYLLYMELGLGIAAFPGYQNNSCWGLKTGCSVYFGNRAYCAGSITKNSIEDLKRYYGAIPFQWTIEVDNIQAQQELERSGFKKAEGTWPAMHVNLDLVIDPTYAAGVTVKKIVTMQELHTWLSIVAQNFTGSEKEMSIFNDYIVTHGDPTKVHRYIGYLHGTPASASLAIEHDDTVSIHWVSTPEKYRGKGLGYAVTYQILFDAKQKNLKEAVLMASALGKPIYEKMGFKDCASYYIYIYDSRKLAE